MSSAQSKAPHRPPRRNFAKIHKDPLPLVTYPLPAFYPSNPLSLLSLVFTVVLQTFFPPTSHERFFNGYFDAATQSVHVTDQADIRGLWEQGFFGKGSLSRSEPEWLEREKRRQNSTTAMGGTSGEVTGKRREERRQAKRERAKQEREAIEEQLKAEGKLHLMNGNAKVPSSESKTELQDASRDVVQVSSNAAVGKSYDTLANIGDQKTAAAVLQKCNSTMIPGATNQDSHRVDSSVLLDQEHLQLTAVEAFFLVYGLGVLVVLNKDSKESISPSSLFRILRENSYFPPSKQLRSDDPFLLSYVVYHHFRSLGWVVRPGIKFACDYLLYARGPVFAHAEFAVLIVPSYRHEYWRSTEDRRLDTEQRERKDWWELHCINRVETQVKKSLVLAYVEVPPPVQNGQDIHLDIGEFLKSYSVREFMFRRWSANRNRD